MLKSVLELARELAAGRTTSRALTEAMLARIDDPNGEGSRVFVRVDRDGALAAADHWDRMRKLGHVPGPIAGLPVSIKDLFDIQGQPTPAGSTFLVHEKAAADAPVVARLRAAGAVLIGRTNMTEFAYSGLGLNPHYGTPGNPFDRARVPGGSSSGAGVSVADGMSVIGLGTDTGGSVRIPAAFCGIVGFKPTARRIPLAGGVPLSTTLDSYGPLVPSVACAAIADAILAGEEPSVPEALPISGLRLGVITNFVTDALDQTVARACERALARLSRQGARLVDLRLDALEEIPKANRTGGFAASEAYAWHRPYLETHKDAYDPQVRSRILMGAGMSAADYVDLLRRRVEIRAMADRASAPFDALLAPTIAIVPPRMDEVARDEEYRRINMLILRNPSLFNFLDRCALTLPIQEPGELPVGLMAIGETMGDRRLLAVGRALEAALRV
ncbi:MAG: amidase [Alphaproteobacteria bacterium]|nr:amidase [Alphaproteobacteria bacterium]